MTKEQYETVRNDPKADTMPVFYYFFLSRGGMRVTFQQFVHAFSIWAFILNGGRLMPRIQFNVFRILGKEFNIS